MAESGSTVISTEMIVRRSDRVAYREIATGGVLLSLDNGQYYNVNDVGRAIWGLLADGTVGDLLRELRDRFEEPPPELERDAIEFLDELLDRGLVEVSAHPTDA